MSIRQINDHKAKYNEVSIEEGIDRFWRNPLTITYQYEYALYKAVCELFESVECSSRCIDSLKLYFCELPHRPESSDSSNINLMIGKKRKTQEGLLLEMRTMVERDVIGNVTFPLMHICRATVRVITGFDGTHTFLFSDEIYGFGLHLDMTRKGNVQRITVADPTKLTVHFQPLQS